MVQKTDFLSEKDLVVKAAAHLGIALEKETDEECLSYRYSRRSVKLGSHALTQKFKTFLETLGFSVRNGTGDRAGMFYITDEKCGNTTVNDTFCSHNYAWDMGEVSTPRFEPMVELAVNNDIRGIRLIPHVWGNMSGGPAWEPTVRRMMQALAIHFKDAHPVVKKFADVSPDAVVVSFGELGYAGVKRVRHLFFSECFRGNDVVERLANSSASPFDPDPAGNPHGSGPNSEPSHFVPETLHAELFAQWKAQLKQYVAALNVA